jgi:ABC-type phosphate/phosphonate transport system substrate-binding protein
MAARHNMGNDLRAQISRAFLLKRKKTEYLKRMSKAQWLETEAETSPKGTPGQPRTTKNVTRRDLVCKPHFLLLY